MRRANRVLSAAFLAIGVAASGLAATVTVTSTGDTVGVDGAVTLREAMFSINNGANVNADVVAVGAYGTNDTINFSIGSGVQTITLASGLPGVAVQTVVDGTTQPGFAGTPVIVVDGANVASTFRVLSTGPSTIRGLVIQRFTSNGITVDATANGTIIAGNYVGTDVTGTLARPNGFDGIVLSGAPGCTVGGSTAADRNLISGNARAGLNIASLSSGAFVKGNFIGTNAAGTAAIPNGAEGIAIVATNATIGGSTVPGPCTGDCNLISGNVGAGIGINTSGSLITGNRIGTQVGGISPLGNGFGGTSPFDGGIYVSGSGHRIGGTAIGLSNTIAFNNDWGVVVLSGNNNFIIGNSIYGNASLGISLSTSTIPTGNDSCDVDGGPNNHQNFPIITSAPIAGGLVQISGTLDSLASTTFRLEFFSSVTCNAAGNGDGKSFLGAINVTTNGSCAATFGPLALGVPPGETVITATATDQLNNTSEFSPCVSGGAPPPTGTPTLTPTPTPTSTPAGVATSTPTLVPTAAPGGVAVPTAEPGTLVFLGLALVAVALFVLKRRL